MVNKSRVLRSNAQRVTQISGIARNPNICVTPNKKWLKSWPDTDIPISPKSEELCHDTDIPIWPKLGEPCHPLGKMAEYRHLTQIPQKPRFRYICVTPSLTQISRFGRNWGNRVRVPSEYLCHPQSLAHYLRRFLTPQLVGAIPQTVMQASPAHTVCIAVLPSVERSRESWRFPGGMPLRGMLSACRRCGPTGPFGATLTGALYTTASPLFASPCGEGKITTVDVHRFLTRFIHSII